MKAIITFYTKAKAFEPLAHFYDSCAQVSGSLTELVSEGLSETTAVSSVHLALAKLEYVAMQLTSL